MMSQSGKQFAELRGLLSAMDEGELTAEQEARLEQLVAENVAARQFYLEYVFLVGKLRFDYGAGSRLLATAPPRSPILGFLDHLPDDINWRTHPARFFTVAVLLTLLSWVGFYFYVLPAVRGDREVVEQPDEEVLPFVAKLWYAVDAQWGGDEATAPQPGYHLRQGRKLELKSGMAEIHFKSGAHVILEGPCQFTLDGLNAGNLHVGKLSARVPKEAIGLLVDTPFASVTDLGTQFGVEVDDEVAQVAVYEGEVRIEVADTSGRKKAVRVTKGGTATVDRTGNLTTSSRGAEELKIVREVRRPEPRPAAEAAPRSEAIGPHGIVAPSGVNPATGKPWKAGDKYHLVFVTSTKRDATARDIAVLNAFVNDAAGKSSLPGVAKVTWYVIATTGNHPDSNTLRAAARDNAVVSAPIYLLDGTTKVADGAAEIWGAANTIQHPINMDEGGAIVPAAERVFTGTTNEDGYEGSNREPIRAVGGRFTDYGYAGQRDHRWIDQGHSGTNEYLSAYRWYALSEPLTVAAATKPSPPPPPREKEKDSTP